MFFKHRAPRSWNASGPRYLNPALLRLQFLIYPHISCNFITLVRIFCDDSEVILSRISALCPRGQTFLWEKHLKGFANHIHLVKMIKTWNNFGKEFASERVEDAYITRTIFSCIAIAYLKSCVCLLLVAVTLPATSASCERSFSKLKLVKIIPRNFMTSERLGNTDLLAVERY